MKIYGNYHTHCKLCGHAKGMPEDYVQKAIELSMKEIAITDHAPFDEAYMEESHFNKKIWKYNMSLEEFDTIYLPTVEETIKKYGDKIKIYKGVETEYLPQRRSFYEGLLEKLDFMVCGLHFFTNGVDVYNTYCDVDYQTLYVYLDNAIKAMESGLFKILVHPDCFMYNYRSINGKREFDEVAHEVSKKIIECAIKNNIILEINCQGIRNSEDLVNADRFRYPYKEFWMLASKYKDLKVVLGCDSHTPTALNDYAVLEGYEFAKECNINLINVIDSVNNED